MKTKTILKEKWRNHQFNIFKKALAEKQNIVNVQNDKKLIDQFARNNQFASKIHNQETQSPENIENFGNDNKININNHEVKQINPENLFSEYKVKQLKKQLNSQRKVDFPQSHLQTQISSNTIKNSARFRAKSYIENPYLMKKYLEDVKLPFINKDESNISLINYYKSPKKQNLKQSKTTRFSNKSVLDVMINVPLLTQQHRTTQSDLTKILPKILTRNLSRFEDGNPPSLLFEDYINQAEQIKNKKALIRLKSILKDQIQRRHLSEPSNQFDIMNEKNSKGQRIDLTYSEISEISCPDILNKRKGSLFKVFSRSNHHLFRPKMEKKNKLLPNLKVG